MTTHNSHPDIINRLKRAEGHLKSIITMLEDERACLDIAQQLQAVESAIGNAKKIFVRDHTLVMGFSVGLALTMVTSGVLDALSITHVSKR